VQQQPSRVNFKYSQRKVIKRNLIQEFTSNYRQVYYDETDTYGVIMHLAHGPLRNTLSTAVVTSVSRHNSDTRLQEK
jgi:hypothetical protein